MGKTFRIVLFWVVLLGANYALCATWEDVTGGISDKEFFSVASSRDGDTIYIGTSAGLYRRDKGDKDWKQIFASRGQYRGVKHICVDAEGTIYIATKGGFYKSRDAGGNWQRAFRGMAEENYCLYIICDHERKGTLYLGTLKGLFWTNDSGKTWSRPAGALGDSRVNAISTTKAPDGKLSLFVICDNGLFRVDQNFDNYRKVFGSDSLKSFETTDEFPEGIALSEESETTLLLNHITARDGILYLSTNRGLFSSEDGGASWEQFSRAGLLNRWINYTVVSEAGARIFSATRGGIFEYDEKSALWHELYSGMESKEALALLLTKKEELWAACRRRIYKQYIGYKKAAQEKPLNPEKVLSGFKNEPTVNEAMDMAIVYAEVYPGKIDKWRLGAKFKALLPRVNFGLDRGWSDTYEIYTSSQNAYMFNGPQDRTEGWDLNLSWDLADLIWNNAQTTIDIRSKLMVQLRDDIVDEVTRAYFERRRLQIELLTDPPNAILKLLKTRLRIQELTATLDGLTGSQFSQSIKGTAKSQKGTG